ncbi:Serine/threonine protein kinase [Handroanthus impetiginosus]|uniref:non-specific serine/threonine protein kinase n=1 Tax=Handroanthus impetiginosus TaxID=429701 RepID=A0A2G9I1Z3_9LAMI|nr:Serine/threonine protein kinase [Handroanthus impetiginosus]
MDFIRANLFPLALFSAQCLMACLATALTDINNDGSALLALRSRLTIDTSHVLYRNWSDPTSVCSWIGVTCGSRHQRVTALDISAMGLAGDLPPEMGNLTFLVYLNLSSNSFHGILPKELAQMRRLKVIDFKFNNFTGEIPYWFRFLRELHFLNLRNNSFTGVLPNSISNVSKLEMLDLSYNSLEGKVPEEIGNLYNLKSLIMQFNKFSGPIPITIFNISNLEILALTRNNLSGELPAGMCYGLPGLKALYLSFNEFEGQVPSNISQCSQLRNISLSYNKFSGPIPREIGNLRALEMLYLGANYLTGEIPEELGKLQKLKVLDIGTNFFIGSIPSAIFNISSLERINIASCSLSGPLPLDMCSRSSQLRTLSLEGECLALENVELSFNNITGTIPRSVGNLTKLQTFYVSDNNLIGTIPKEIGNLHNLELLDLGVNNLRGSIPKEIFNISTLRWISVSVNQLTGYLPSNFGYGLPNLQELRFNNNNLSGEIPHSISNSSKLMSIIFHGNQFSGLVPNSLGELTFLKDLYLSENNFVAESLELKFINSLTNCRYLRKLSLAGNIFNSIIPASIGNLSTSLSHFYCYNCGLHGSIPEEVGNLTNLLVLSLFDNQLTGSIPKTLGNFQNLQGLDICQNRVSGSIPDNLCGLENLNILSLFQNQITGAIPDCIGNLTALRYLYIGNNKLNSGIPASLWQLNDLLELNLSSNSLTGFLSLDIGNLKVATLLDLSINRFSGIIPTSIGDLQNLINLSLAHNRFERSIPESIGKLLNLGALDLSHNNLSSNIPKSLEAFRYLIYFDVSFNDLSGEIPSGGPFKNFGSQSFVSNGGLCGDPRFGVPQCPITKVHKPKRRKEIFRVLYPLLGVLALAFFLVLAYLFIRYRRKQVVKEKKDISYGTTWLRVSYYDLQQATEGFSESHLLGTGGFSSVYKGTLKNGEEVAVKVFNLELEGAFKSFDIECEVLRTLRHRNLCKVISTCSNEQFKALIFEYMPNGSLEKWLYSDDYSLDFMQRINIMIAIADALEYLHHGYSIPIAHCDLKPSNVLLDQDMVSHLSDFGIAKLLHNGDSFAQTNTFATLGYIAPVFTRRKPSSEAFTGDLSLRRWVKDVLPDGITKVMDPKLLNPEEDNFKEKLECLSSIMEVALNCSTEIPGERISMKDVVAHLNKIRIKLLENFSSSNS